MEENVIASNYRESWFTSWLRWCPTSCGALQNAEKQVLSFIQTKFESFYVNTGPVVGKSNNFIRTLCFNGKSRSANTKTPLVLIHGFGSGVGLWVLNVDSLAEQRPVYGFDLLGFGRSSRPAFSSCAESAESQFIESIEKWREQVGLERFALLGHSLGAFIASSYALKYPERVNHLILADPWGYPERKVDHAHRNNVPSWVRVVGSILQLFNPLAGLRAVGPMGPRLIEKLRGDLVQKFSKQLDDDSNSVINYIYHCNAQTPSGESAFKAMTSGFGWAKFPMINRIGNLHENIPLTLIYGSRSWIDRQPAAQIKFIRNNSYVDVHVIQGSGHHVYADNVEEFNLIVHKACELTDLAYSHVPDDGDVCTENDDR